MSEPVRVRLTDEGPLLIDGPVEVVGADGRTARSDRFTTAICTCRRSRSYPLCDTAHRDRVRSEDRDG